MKYCKHDSTSEIQFYFGKNDFLTVCDNCKEENIMDVKDKYFKEFIINEDLKEEYNVYKIENFDAKERAFVEDEHLDEFIEFCEDFYGLVQDSAEIDEDEFFTNNITHQLEYNKKCVLCVKSCKQSAKIAGLVCGFYQNA